MNSDTQFRYLSLAVPGVAELLPYQPGKPIEELQRQLGIERVVKMASNENPLGPSDRVIACLQSKLGDVGRYPDGNGYALKQALSSQLSVEHDQITLGNGSNDVLELLARAFLSEHDEVIYSQYAFAVYALVSQAVNAKAVVTPAKNWGHDVDAILAAVTERTKLIFIANPNNPTGTWLQRSGIEKLLSSVPDTVIIVIDEAYIEYCIHPEFGIDDFPNALSYLQSHPNVVVTRTFSKAYGLAGLRVGYAISNSEIADVLNRVRQPFNVNSLALLAARQALSDEEHLQAAIRCNAEGMQQLKAGFEHLGLDYIPSAANFISVEFSLDTQLVYESLLRLGVIVRPVNNYQMPNHLRVSVGLDEENQIFLQSLTNVLASAND